MKAESWAFRGDNLEASAVAQSLSIASLRGSTVAHLKCPVRADANASTPRSTSPRIGSNPTLATLRGRSWWGVYFAWCWLFWLWSFCQAAPAANQSAVEGRLNLFNGRDLSGFYTWLVDSGRRDPRAVFTVTDGQLRISGDGLGYLATEKEYSDYHLIVEFRWGKTNFSWGDRIGKARDSGIFLHAVGPDGNSHDGKGAFMAAIECNVFQGATGDFLLIRGTAADGQLIAPRLTAETASEPDPDGWFTWEAGGQVRTLARWGRVNWFGKSPRWRDELDFRGPRDLESRSGEWTRVECICSGSRITIIVNGTVVNRAFDVHPTRGKILLQCEGSEIFFRRVELRPLDQR